MWSPFHRRGGEPIPAGADRVASPQEQADSLQSLWQDAKGEAQRVLAGVIAAKSKREGELTGKEDEQQWLELADQRLKNAIDDLGRARDRRQETTDFRADDLAELERVRADVSARIRELPAERKVAA